MSLLENKNLKHFYINEEQSFYLLSHQDARKLKDWLNLCETQLSRLGYHDIEMVGNGAYGFVFAGSDHSGKQYVFKFARMTLPQHIQDRLEDEGFMLSALKHPGIPQFIEFQNLSGQSILMMERAAGITLEQLSHQRGRLAPRLILSIAGQMATILLYLRQQADMPSSRLVVHGDIKPSNIMFDRDTETVSLIDWGAAVHAQLNIGGERINGLGLGAIDSNFSTTNAKLGDIYFIGDEQLQGDLSSPRFDEQGLAGTLYALASGQGSRFGKDAITPESLGLPVEFAKTIAAMLAGDSEIRRRAGDYFLDNMQYMKRIVSGNRQNDAAIRAPLIPFVLSDSNELLDSVVYSSRKGFLRQAIGAEKFDAQVYRDSNAGDYSYYKNYLIGMGDTEKAFIIAVSHLGHYPVVGGLAINWDQDGVSIDSSLNLYNAHLAPALVSAINNMVHLGRAINHKGVFKSCMFDARKTLHISRETVNDCFIATPGMQIPFDCSDAPMPEDETRLHSYFEDGSDPDEMLQLPNSIMRLLTSMNQIQHTGCIIFEAVEKDLKIHNYLTLLDTAKVDQFRQCLEGILDNIQFIEGLGVSGFMKLPYKNTKFFTHLSQQPIHYLAKH
jgi:non-specific serine/threonine protein kinase